MLEQIDLARTELAVAPSGSTLLFTDIEGRRGAGRLTRGDGAAGSP
jgi:hypothetical protein